ncbi:MAG: glycosyltransferase family 39 protein [Pseudomonadota bacterium]
MKVQENIKISAFLILCACIMLGNLGGWDLGGADEPRYAQIAREMLETGQYILPHINAETYPDKPPFLFWLISLAAKPFGDVTAFPARLPSVLAGLGSLVLVYFFAKKMYGPRTGLLAAAILFTSKEFFTTCLSVHFDLLLTFWTTLSLLLFYHGYVRAEGGKKYFILSYVSMGLALFTKGPVGFVVPLIAIALFLITKKEFRSFTAIELGKGALIIPGILALWLIPACIIGGSDYTQNILLKQTFGRTVNSFAHKAPFYYYMLQFPLDFLPWTVFIPGACIYFWKNKREKLDILFPLVWFAGTFLLFSLVSGKRALYLLPLYPAAAIIMAKFWEDVIKTGAAGGGAMQKKFITIPSYLLFGAATAGGVGAIIALMGNLSFIQELAPLKSTLFPVACLFMAGGCAGIFFLRRKKDLKYCFYATAVFMVGISLLTVFSIFPAVKNFKSGVPFCEKVHELLGADTQLLASFQPDFFNYCLHKYPIPVERDIVALEKMFISSEKIYYLARENDYAEAPDEFKNMVAVLEKGKVGHTMIYLLVNRAGLPPYTKGMPGV